MDRVLSSLSPAPISQVRAVAERLVDHGATLPRPPSLRPTLQRALVVMAQSPLGGLLPSQRKRIRGALEDVGAAVLHTLARFEEEDTG